MMDEFMDRMTVRTANPAEPPRTCRDKTVNPAETARTCRDTLNTMRNELNEIYAMLQNLAGFVGVEPPTQVDEPVNCLPDDLLQMAKQLDADLACINRVCNVLGI